MNKVAQTLFQLYCEDRMAPFYIIRPPVAGRSSQYSESLKRVYIDLSCLILAKHKYQDTQHTLEIGHSDIIFIEKEEKLKDYKKDDPGMLNFFNAQKHGPLSLKKKFIWIDQADHITERFLNKWLKTLEEPTADITTLFLVPHHAPLLQTIESRGITLKLSETGQTLGPKRSFTSFGEFLNAHPDYAPLFTTLKSYLEKPDQAHQAIEALKGKPELQHQLFLSFQEFWSCTDTNPRQLQRALEEIKWYQESKTYNNMPSERIYGLLSCLSEKI